MSEASGESIKTSTQFDDTPQGWQRRWAVEFAAATEWLQDFKDQGHKIVKIFLAKDQDLRNRSLLNLFTANVQTLRALLYGKVPHVDVKRRWGDPDDPVARAAAEMMQRLLNTDIERDGDTYTRALKYVLSDRLLAGMGNARIRYTADFKTKKVDPKFKMQKDAEGNDTQEQELDDQGQPQQLAPGYEEEQKEYEDVVVDYTHWDDQLWSAGSRTFEEWRWWACRCPMTQDELVKRFGDCLSRPAQDGRPAIDGKELAKQIPLNSKDNRKDSTKLAGNNPWDTADVWEIWDKEHRKVWWYVEGFEMILDDKPDPYELEGFWPFPEPLCANLTTDAYVPRADFIMAQDLYDEINVLSGRIKLLEEAVRCVGLYNGNSNEVKRLLSEAGFNQMIGVEEWRQFADSGGIEGNIAWFPMEQVAKAIGLLEQQRQAKIGLLYQVTGMSDIMRGQATGPTTATEQAIKAKFASVRVQEFQENFARFASDLQRLRGELIMKLFDDQTIINRSNIQFTQERQFAAPALKLLRDEFVAYRIEVKPESVSATDYAAMQQERVVAMQMVGQFLQAIVPIAQAQPDVAAELMGMLPWVFVGFRGGNTIEQAIDRAVQKAQAAAQKALQAQMQPPPPDPKVEAEKVKAGAEVTKAKMGLQQAQVDHNIHMQEAAVDVQKKKIDTELDIRKMEAQLQRDALRPQTPPASGADR